MKIRWQLTVNGKLVVLKYWGHIHVCSLRVDITSSTFPAQEENVTTWMEQRDSLRCHQIRFPVNPPSLPRERERKRERERERERERLTRLNYFRFLSFFLSFFSFLFLHVEGINDANSQSIFRIIEFPISSKSLLMKWKWSLYFALSFYLFWSFLCCLQYIAITFRWTRREHLVPPPPHSSTQQADTHTFWIINEDRGYLLFCPRMHCEVSRRRKEH